MKRGYVAALAIAAALVLVAGALVRPKPHPKQPVAAAAPPPPPRGSEMRQISDFLAERSRRVAAHMVYSTAAHASGVMWPSGQIVTIGAAPALVQTAGQGEALPATLAPPDRLESNGWMVLAGRTADDRPISASGMLGGSAEATCGSVPVRRLLFNIPLDETFAGAGVFDVSGTLLGIVVRCADSWIAIAHTTVQERLEHQIGPESVAWNDFGVRIAAPDAAERKELRLPKAGLFVTEVRRGSAAANVGIVPGDVLLRTDDRILERGEDLLKVGETVTIWHNGRQITAPVTPPFSLSRPPTATVLTSVQPGTRLHAAGLRAGDRIVTANAERLISARAPAWIIYEREDRIIGALLR